ncbi:MAG: hypothetical protein J1E82_08605 [Muribaculaceae bacterium]|nr:hypothetical protein [Muribaculaceae bacterium]
MKIKTRHILPMIAIVAFMGCNKVKTPEASIEREQWIGSFSDSIAKYQQRLAEINVGLNELNEQLGRELNNFSHVSNPREVTGYYILKGWEGKVPMTSTGIYARISEDEKLELIATLSGGTFNRITVSGSEGTISSQTVPHDQALNYRQSGYNTVCFIGNASDSVAQFIAQHKNERLTLNFLGGSQKKAFVIPENEKDMIARSCNLLNVQQEQKQLQKELWITSRRLDVFQQKLEKTDSLRSNQNK